MSLIIFTKHALQRMDERGFLRRMAEDTVNSPDIVIDGKNKGTKEFQKQINTHRITVITRKNDKDEWIVLSCWIDPPLPGTKDYRQQQYYRKYQKAGFWGKLWLTTKSQLGL